MSDLLMMALSIRDWPGTSEETADLVLHPSGLADDPQTVAKVAAIAALVGLADIATSKIPFVRGGLRFGVGAVELADMWLDLPSPVPREFFTAATRTGRVLVTLSAYPPPVPGADGIDALYRDALTSQGGFAWGRLWVGSLGVIG